MKIWINFVLKKYEKIHFKRNQNKTLLHHFKIGLLLEGKVVMSQVIGRAIVADGADTATEK